MRPLSLVQRARPRTIAGKLALSALLVLVAVPYWTGPERIALLDRDFHIATAPYVPPGGWPRRVGALVPVGAITLTGTAAAFGGFSAISVARGRVTLLSDGGNWVSFALVAGKVRDARNGYLPDGPGTGWLKAQRDSESLVRDPVTGRLWVGFENANEIWRYAPGFARGEARARPAPMREWRSNSGAEALVRLDDGRFVAVAEGTREQARHKAVVFSGDPTAPTTRAAAFRFVPPTGFRPSDAAVEPGTNTFLMLTRRFELPFRFRARLVRVASDAVRADATVTGRTIATLDDVVAENCEGVAVTREGRATYVWIVTDNDESSWRPTILMKFRLVG